MSWCEVYISVVKQKLQLMEAAGSMGSRQCTSRAPSGFKHLDHSSPLGLIVFQGHLKHPDAVVHVEVDLHLCSSYARAGSRTCGAPGPR